MGGFRINRRRTAGILVCVSAAAIALAAGCSSSSTGPDDGAPVTIIVDAGGSGDYLTIEAGIAASSEGDTVLVTPGVYSGSGNRDLDFGGVNIVLKAASARDSTVIDCEGQGRAFEFDSGEDGDSVIEGFVIKNGSAAEGGAIRCDGSSPTIIGVVFRSNTAEENGGAVYCDESSLTLTDVTFANNTVEGERAESGGAIFCLHSSPVIEDAIFDGNVSGGSGGAIGSIFSSMAVDGATFIGNLASSAGGAIFLGSADWARDETSFDNMTLVANTAYRGGAVSLSESSPSITHASFARNVAVFGGGIFCQNGSEPSIANTIIAFSNGGGALVCFDGTDVPATTRSCIFGNAGGDDLCGSFSENLFVDPLFCDMNEDDVSLCENSPCLPDNNAWGALIGALSSGCAECGESAR